MKKSKSNTLYWPSYFLKVPETIKKSFSLFLVFSFLFSIETVAQLTFDPPLDYAMGVNRRVELFDADHDGDLDMLSPSATGVSLRLNNGAGVFGAPITYLSGTNVYALSFADLNNDNFDDIIANTWTDMHILYNDAGSVGTFINGSTLSLPSSYPLKAGGKGGFKSVDINGDNLPDVVVNASTENDIQVQVFLNSPGTPGLLVHNADYAVFNGLSSHELQVVDINADNDLDVIMTVTRNSFGNPIPGHVFYLLGNGNGTFQTAVLVPTSGSIWEAGIEVADMDGVAPLDVIIGNSRSDDLRINHDITNPNSVWTSFNTQGDVYGIDVIDIDADGDQDVIAAVFNGPLQGVQIHYNNGNGVLTQYQRLSSARVIDVQVANLNADALLDITAGRYWFNQATVWLQQPPPPLGSIEGLVKCSNNNNCNGQTLAPNQNVCFDDGTNTFIISTDQNGAYSFNNAVVGTTYDVDLCAPPSCSGVQSTTATSGAVSMADLVSNNTCDLDVVVTGMAGGPQPPTCQNNAPPVSPCPGNTWRYCVKLENNGCDDIMLTSLDLFFEENMTPLSNSDYNYVNGSVQDFTDCNNILPPISPNSIPNGAGNISYSSITIPAGACYEMCLDIELLDFVTPLRFVVDGNLPCQVGGNGELGYKQYDLLCSCDPNYKTAYPNGCGTNNTIVHQPIDYRINFGNIGTGPAGDIWVQDFLDSDFDYSTFVMGNSSHPFSQVQLNQNTGELQVHFDGINLAAGAQGWFEFTITPDVIPPPPFPGYPSYFTIRNNASIFFDNNAPVVTNTVTHTVIEEALDATLNTDCETIYVGYSQDLCVDLSVTASGGVGGTFLPYTYEWNTGEATTTINVCPDATTTYSVTVSDYVGCKVVKDVTVHVVDVRCGRDGEDILICFEGKTLCVSLDTAEKYFEEGAQVGPCEKEDCETVDATLVPMQRQQLTELQTLKVYPNPTRGNLSIELSDNEPIQGIKIFDLYGRMVLQPDTKSNVIDVSRLNKGIYLIEVETASTKLISKVIKE